MQLRAEQTVDLLDAQKRQMGQIRIERQENDLLFGLFVPGPAFSNVEKLFHDFEEAVDAQALHVVDELDVAIAGLGLYLYGSGVSEPIDIQDVQIWRDGGITCRLCGWSAAPTNAKL